MNESLNDDFRIYVVTFMPDHLHLLLEGKSDSSDLIKGIKLFKQKSGYWYKQCADRRLWQKRFFDRILRRSEDLESVAWYIINNPVRDNLVDDPFEYPFTKSFVWNDLREIEPGL